MSGLETRLLAVSLVGWFLVGILTAVLIKGGNKNTKKKDHKNFLEMLTTNV